MNNEIGLYLTIAAMVAIVLFTQINKLTKKIDEDEANGIDHSKNMRENFNNELVKNKKIPSAQSPKYAKFCDDIKDEIEKIKKDALNFDALKDESLKEIFSDRIDRINQDLSALPSAYKDKDTSEFETAILEILNDLENLIENNFKEPNLAIDRLRLNLENKFKAL